MASTDSPNEPGAPTIRGASSSLTMLPWGAYMKAMLWATTRRAPAAAAAASRLRVPSRRIRLFGPYSGLRRSILSGSEVI